MGRHFFDLVFWRHLHLTITLVGDFAFFRLREHWSFAEVLLTRHVSRCARRLAHCRSMVKIQRRTLLARTNKARVRRAIMSRLVTSAPTRMLLKPESKHAASILGDFLNVLGQELNWEG